MRFIRRRPVMIDLLVALGLCVLDLLVSWDTDRSGGLSGGVATPVYAVAGYLALVWRRRYPLAVYLVMLVHSILAYIVVPGFVPTLGVWLALYTVASRCSRLTSLCALVAAYVPTALNVADEVRRAPPAERSDAFLVSAVLGVLFTTIVFGVGRWVAWSRRQRQLVAELAAAEAVTAERNRIARDMHDIVAHSVSLMLLQAGAAAAVLTTAPASAARALQTVDTLGQQAIRELHHLLGVLDSGSSDPDATTPPNVAHIVDLVRQLSTSGVPIAFTVTGAPESVDPGVDVCAYRIAQEALTNIVKYSDVTTTAGVQVRWGHEEVVLDFRNTSNRRRRPGSHRLSTGHGLVGMRERAKAVGGRCESERLDDGTFHVVAVLPHRMPALLAGQAPAAQQSDRGRPASDPADSRPTVNAKPESSQ
ncbi:hypothetical protein E0H73_41065 [Kribbella pittospori]|uniref:histidine kinase n=1 Tax=Kribbella pittospori TaxID=722689 RepID=A0A4R0JXH2_9ACTN|nr:histidine kinase [Kribbella pittospori]TCC51510.1 hypothetical protein E0H73_41065 [Kribbella pittospori]